MKRNSTRLTAAAATLPQASVFGRAPPTRKHPGGLPRRPVDLAEVGRLMAEGFSLRATARVLRLGFGTIHKAVRDAGGRSAVIENCARGCV